MDQALNQLLHWETIYLAVLVVIGTFFTRRIVETAVPSCKQKVNGKLGNEYTTKFGLWWNSVILYAIPVVLGGIIAFGAYGHYLPENIDTRGGAVMWGGIVGWFSSFIYKVFRKFLIKKTGVDPTPGPSEPTKKLTEEELKEPLDAELGADEKQPKKKAKKDEEPEKAKDEDTKDDE